ncbi:MAG: 23S rRNA (uracil(1939)-C(5))-methyltransferase RlmD [Paludibacteraceae bacterium]|nr:23S rRNA (uracil(1939)-C(5))-methyltransferase RlmD [Paludibacteraceae bacterium]
MKKKNLPLYEGVEITGVAAEGKALFKVQRDDVPCTKGEGIVVFVPNCVPGDIADVQIIKKKHSYMEGKVVRIVQSSAVRTEARCPHFGVCGGCKWQILPYEEQLRYKQQQIIDNLTRIGHLTLPGGDGILPIKGSQKIYEYRNKLEFSCSDRKWLPAEEFKKLNDQMANDQMVNGIGFHIPGAFDKVLDIQTCHLMPEINNRIRNTVRQYAVEHGFSFYNEHTHEGLLRTLILRNNHKGEIMLIVSFGAVIARYKDQVSGLLEHLHTEFPEIVALMYVENTKYNDTIGDLDVKVYWGQDHLIEEMEGLQFKVGPKSFYQTNTDQAYELYKVAREFALEPLPTPSDHAGSNGAKPLIYDLYTGTGTIANFVAREARQVIGIEYVPEAIEDAKTNSKINHIENTLFFAGDMKDILNDAFVAKYGRPDVIITDPPRAGMHEDVVNVILNAEPQRIVYVSCNPATQARDLALLEKKYTITKVQPVDMFPHTQHVENVAQLELKVER